MTSGKRWRGRKEEAGATISTQRGCGDGERGSERRDAKCREEAAVSEVCVRPIFSFPNAHLPTQTAAGAFAYQNA